MADSPKVIKDSSIRRRRGTAGMMDYDIAPSWLVRVSFFFLSLFPLPGNTRHVLVAIQASLLTSVGR